MSSHSGRLVAVAAIVCALVGAGPAGAQTPAPQGGDTPRTEAPRPYRGLFGSGQNPASPHSLTLSGSVYAGRDDNVLADQPGVGIGPSADESAAGTLYGGSLGLDYGKHGRRVDFGLSVSSGTRVYPDQRDLTAGSYGFGAGLSARMSRRATLRLSQNASYQPFYQLSLFPVVGDPVLGEVIPSNLDYVVSRDSGWLFGTSASYAYQLSSRSNVSLEYTLSKSKFDVEETGAAAQRNLDSQSGGFRFSRSLTRHASLRLGYIYRRGSYAGTPTPGVPNLIEGHDIDAGVDYSRDLSLFRRTHFSFGTGTSILNTGGRTLFRVLGNAALRYEISRTWYASLRYNRDVGFAGSFPEPIFADNLALTINGFLGPRVNVSFGGGLSTGDIGADVRESVGAPNRDTSFTTYTANASVQYAMSAYLALFASYSYFSYDFPLDPLLPVVGNQGRNGVRGGLSFTLPLLR